MSGGLRKQDGHVKVTIIETQFVKTDIANFMSVVQQFTGKDSKVETAPQTCTVRPQARKAMPIMAQSQTGVSNGSRGSEASWEPQTCTVRPQARKAMPIMAQSQTGVGNGSRGSEASWEQNGAMLDREAAFMVDLEPFLTDMYKFIDT